MCSLRSLKHRLCVAASAEQSRLAPRFYRGKKSRQNNAPTAQEGLR
jgi:hypothetical protein